MYGIGRLKRGATEQSMIIRGLRGVGKTVLLNAFEDRAESEGLPLASMFGPILAVARTPMREAAERMTRRVKRCSKCGQERPLEAFNAERAPWTGTVPRVEGASKQRRARPTGASLLELAGSVSHR
jgi:hypothetical protein